MSSAEPHHLYAAQAPGENITAASHPTAAPTKIHTVLFLSKAENITNLFQILQC
jgi:hypothetical protein